MVYYSHLLLMTFEMTIMKNCYRKYSINISNYCALNSRRSCVAIAAPFFTGVINNISRLTRVAFLLVAILIYSNANSQTVYSRHLNPISGTEYDTATTSGCATCQISDPANAADTSLNNYTKITVQGSSGDKASIRLLLTTSVSAGGNAGIVFVRSGGANPAVLNSLSVSTYKNDTLQETMTGSSLTSYVISSTSGLRAVEFTSTKDYDAVEFEIRRLGGGINEVEVYYAYGNNSAPLPIELKNFHAHQEKKFIRVNWTTASEKCNSHFLLEKSTDGINFTNIENIKGHGNTNNIKHYSTIDFRPEEGLNYYRLVQVDNNNEKTYSKTISVEFKKHPRPPITPPTIYPNPAVNSLKIEFEQDMKCGTIEIKDMMGNTLISQHINPDSRIQEIDLSSINTGTYIVYISGKDGEVISKKLITKF